mmetsp:Transcript_4510/g.5827  ORF Transcript_4510/g.5827 Transcript_4510/m.5827 type:complete len:116 (+) Transcript_4510:220-567(+)
MRCSCFDFIRWKIIRNYRSKAHADLYRLTLAPRRLHAWHTLYVISFLMTLIGVWNFLPFKPRFYTILSGEKSSAETGFSHRISYITFMSYENETFSHKKHPNEFENINFPFSFHL